VASVIDSDKRIDVFARDLDALRLDPPQVNFTISGSGLAKFQDFLRTGRRQEFSTNEVSSPTSTFDFILPDRQISAWKLVLMPSPAATPKIVPLRVTFSDGTEEVRYELIQFRVSRIGTHELEIESISPVPFVLSFELPLRDARDGTFRIQERFEGADVRGVHKALRALSLLRPGGTIQLYALEIDKPIGTLGVTVPAEEGRQKWEEVIADAASVSELYNTDLRIPERISVDDLRSLGLLLAIAKGEELPFDGLNTKLIKSVEHEPVVSSAIGQRLRVLAHLPNLSPPLVVFGATVNTGPVSLLAAEGEIDNGREFMSRYANAKYGEGVSVHFTVRGVHAKLGAHNASHILIKTEGEV
jgi:hypothetical protein